MSLTYQNDIDFEGGICIGLNLTLMII